MVHTTSLWLLSFLRYIDIIIKFHEKWARANLTSRSERKFANDLIKKYRVQGLCFRWNISEMVRDIWVPSAVKIKGKSRATRRYKRRLCSCYRFRDIKSSISWFSNADLYDVPTSKSRSERKFANDLITKQLWYSTLLRMMNNNK